MGAVAKVRPLASKLIEQKGCKVKIIKFFDLGIRDSFFL